MKKILVILISALLLIGCTTHSYLTYNVDTGDSITIKITTSDGYKFSQSEIPFVISKDEESLTGIFATATDYTYMTLEIEDHNGQDINILDRGENNEIEYLFYSWQNEYLYLIYIKNSDTSVQLETTDSQEFIQNCFKGMSFTKE